MQTVYEANSQKPITNIRRRVGAQIKPVERGRLVVGIAGFIIRPEEFRLLVFGSPVAVAAFMRRLETSYAMYFNKKYNNTGSPFSSRYSRALVKRDDLRTETKKMHYQPGIGASTWSEAKQLIDSYRWSSYLDYIGLSNYDEVLDLTLVSQVAGTDYLRYMSQPVEK
jgi:hypothetical protein